MRFFYSEDGYTLIEIMMAVSIVGIMAVLAVFSMNRQSARYHLADAGRQVVSDLRWVRQRAIAGGSSTPAQFDPELGKYLLPGSEERILPPSVRFGLKEGIPPLPDSARPKDGISFHHNRVTFQPNGTMTGVGGAIYLTSDQEENQAVAVSVIATGRVKIRRWTGHEWK
ncbi:MAG: GspH/FimT family pseudopilin [Candidatus Manganitrophaceae bacterium]